MTKTMILLALCIALQGTSATAKPASYQEKLNAWEKHLQMQQNSPFKGLRWRNIGPVVQGGRIVDIEVPKDQPYTFYLAYASGGLWKTTDNGINFKPLMDDQPSMIIGDIAIDPQNSKTIWVGTGEANSSRSSYGGMGIYRSDDAGKSWRHMGLGDSDRISRILIDPRNPQRIFVAALGRLYSKGGQRGVFLSEDGGRQWQQVLAGDEVTGIVDLSFKPDDPDTIYAASWERSRSAWNFIESGEQSAIWKSQDGGVNWSRLSNGLPQGKYVGRIGLAVTAASPDTVYALVDNQQPLPENQWDLGDRPVNAKRLRTMSKETFLQQDPKEIERFIRSNDFSIEVDAASLIEMVREDEISISDILDELNDANANLFNTDIYGLEVYRSDDAGQNWRKTHEQPIDQVAYTYGYYFGQIRVAPDNPDRVYVLGVPLITSDDGGRNWQGLNGRGVHVDHHELWINPENSKHLLLGNDGGVDLSFDGGASWLKLDAQPVGQFYTVNVDMAQPYRVYGGLQDNGTIRCNSQNRWEIGQQCERINGGDGMHVSIDPRDNKTVYTGFQFGHYVRLNPDGSRSEVRPRDGLGEPSLRYNWNTPVTLSSHHPDVVYFGANQLYRSFDQGESWSVISPDLTRSKDRGDVPFATLTSISESPRQFGLIWAGTDDGQVQLTTDSGQNWQNVTKRLPPNRWISRIEASHYDKGRAYISLNAYRNDEIDAHVYVTDNFGRQWRSISQGLPAEAVNVIREDPLVENLLYVGTDRGVFVSVDRGTNWQSLDGGLPNVPVHDLVIHPRERELVAGTHGRSIWIVDILPLQEYAQNTDGAKPLKLYHIDPVQAANSWRSRPSRWFNRPENIPSAQLSIWSPEAGRATIRIQDKQERQIQSIAVELDQGMNQIKWDLLVDQDNVIALEQKTTSEKETTQASDQPYHEAIRLGQPLYILPGDYTVMVQQKQQTSQSELKIKAVKPPPSRKLVRKKIRGYQ